MGWGAPQRPAVQCGRRRSYELPAHVTGPGYTRRATGGWSRPACGDVGRYSAVLCLPGSPAFSPHLRAVGHPKHAGSRFITEVSGRLITTRVLTDDGEEDILQLPRQPGPGRPPVYCPFCGLQGKYRLPQVDPDAFTAHFVHDDGSHDCVEGALESIRHRLAKAALLAGLRHLRETRTPLRGQVECMRCRKPFVREFLEAGAWTTEREEVEDTASARRPDVLALAGASGVFLFEVHVHHRVDAEKSAIYEAGDLSGLELDSSVLLDEENQPRWTGQEPLGLPLDTWHLQRAPRPFSICGECRSGTEDFRTLAELMKRLQRTAPSRVSDFLYRAATRLEVRPLALHNAGPDALVQMLEEPELLRLAWGPVAEAVARKARWPSARDVLLDGLGLEADHWKDTPLPELLANPYAALTKATLERVALPEEALRAADLLVDLQGLDLFAERLKAYAGRVLVQRLPAGHTACKASALTQVLSRATQLRRYEVAYWVQAAAREGSVLTTAPVNAPSGSVALASVANLEARVAEGLNARRWTRKRSSDVSRLSHLSGEQRDAVQIALDYGVSVITGGPGTGKTFVIKSILQASRRQAPQAYWRLAAPTNKAVQRLREVTGMSDLRDTRTVHAWLGRKAELQENPPYGLIVDEAGMLGLEQMAELLDAARHIRRLVLVGDPEQLPSIGFGAVLRDLKISGRVRHVELTQVRRAEDGRGLVEAAQAILAGRIPEEAAGVRIVEPERDDPAAVVDAAFRAYKHLVEESDGRLEDVQGLAPLHELVSRLNTLIQAQYNGRGTKVLCAPRLRVGDRVVCTETLYGRGLINGLQGVVKAATAEGLSLEIEGAESVLAVRGEDAHVLAPAYAMTVHSAQGSEWPGVLIVLDRHSQFIDRSLLYTAATRAKRTLVLVATRSHLERALKNVRRRATLLVDYIVAGTSGRGVGPSVGAR